MSASRSGDGTVGMVETPRALRDPLVVGDVEAVERPQCEVDGVMERVAVGREREVVEALEQGLRVEANDGSQPA